MVLTRSAAKQPSPGGHRERPPRPKRTKQPASSSSSKSSKTTTTSKTKKGLQKVVQIMNDDDHLVEEGDEVIPTTQAKSKKKNGLKLKKEDCTNFASIMSQPLFDQEEAGELHSLFTEFQDALQSRVNTITRSRSGNNNMVAVSNTPLMQKFFAKCPKTRVKHITRPSPIQEESLEVSNANPQSSKTTQVDGAERKRKNGKKKKVSYLLPPKSPLNKRVTRSRAKKGHKNGLLNVTSSTDASVKDANRKDSISSSCSTTASVITNDTGIFSQSQTQSTYQSTPMKSNRKQSEMKKVVLDLVPTTMNSSKKTSSSSSSSTTSKADNDDKLPTDSTTTIPNGKKRQRMESEAIGIFEFNAIQDVQSSKRRLMTHEKENVNVNLMESIKKKKPIVIMERLPKSEIVARTLLQQQQQQNNINMNFQEVEQKTNSISASSFKTNTNTLINKPTVPTVSTTSSTRKNSSSTTTLSTSSSSSNSTITTTTDSIMTVANNKKDSLKLVASKKSTSDENKEYTTATMITTTSRNKSKGTTQDKKKISQGQCKEIPEKDQEQQVRVSSKVSLPIEKASKSETTKLINNNNNNNNSNNTPLTIPSSSSLKCFDETYVKSTSTKNNNNGNQDDEFIPPLELDTTHVIKHSTTKATTTTTTTTAINNNNQTYVVPNLLSEVPSTNNPNQTYVKPIFDQTYVKPTFDQTFDVPIPSKPINTTSSTTNYTPPPNLPISSSLPSTIILPNKTTTKPTSTTTTTSTTTDNTTVPVIDNIQIPQEQQKSNNKMKDGPKSFNNNNNNNNDNKTGEKVNNKIGGTMGKGGQKLSSNSNQVLTPKFDKFPSASSLSSNSSSSSYSSATSQKPRDKGDDFHTNRASPSHEKKTKKPNSESVHNTLPKKPAVVPKSNTLDRLDVCAQKKKEIDEQKREAQRKKNEEWRLKIEKNKQAVAAEAEEKARREKEKQCLDAKKALVTNAGKKDENKIKYPMNPPLQNALKLGGILKSKYIGGLATGGSCPDISKKLAQAKVLTKPGLQNASSTGTLPTSSKQGSGSLGGGSNNNNNSKQIGDPLGSTTNWKPISKTTPLVIDNVGSSSVHHKHTTEPNRPKSPVKIQPQQQKQQQQLQPPPPPPPPIYPTLREPEPIPQDESFYSVAESTFVSQYEITLYQDLDEDLRHRENKPIPNWAKDPEILHKSLFFQQPDLVNCMTRSCFPQKNVGYQIFPTRGINMRK